MIKRRNLSLKTLIAGTALLTLAACGRDTQQTDVKFVGVGVDPEDVGPTPTMYGGVFEYHYVDFAGAGLPLGLMGLVSYDEVGPGFSSIAPPYAMVTGLGFIMQEDLPETDTLFGTFGSAGAEGTCYTNYEPMSYLNMTADAGTEIAFRGTDEPFEFVIGRRPLIYPENNVEGVFTYYMDLDAWIAQPLYHLAEIGPDQTFDEAQEEVLKAANWQHGQQVEVSFPGGIPPEEAGVGSIPMPLAASAGNTAYRLPNKPEGVMMSWRGPVYNSQGELIGSDGTNYSTCLQYLAHNDIPLSVDDCLDLQAPPDDGSSFLGQMYTGPWETEDGVHFAWVPPQTDVGDVVTISVRFLGPTDADDNYKQYAGVEVPVTDSVRDNWDYYVTNDWLDEGDGAEPPDFGLREAQACEDEGTDFEWQIDPTLQDANGDWIVSLQGEPSRTLAEVTCTVPDNGEFVLTEDMLTNAMDYAERHDAGGAIFYMTRSSYADIDTPPVRDRYGQRRDISAIRAVSSSVLLGRFWFNK